MTPTRAPHTWFDDAQGIVAGCVIVALAVTLFQHAGLLTGGTTGLAFLSHYAWGWPLGLTLFVINLPFYALGYRALGPAFTLKTFASVGLLSLLVSWAPRVLSWGTVQPAVASALAGLLAGTGVLILIRHGASLGGIGVMAIYLQKTRQWRAGTVQMAADASIFALSLAWVDGALVAVSLVGAVVMNGVIGVNHRSDRYFGG